MFLRFNHVEAHGHFILFSLLGVFFGLGNLLINSTVEDGYHSYFLMNTADLNIFCN